MINVARLEGCYQGSCEEIGFLMLLVPLAEGNAEQHSEVTWPGLIQEACKVPNNHFFQVITNPVSETAFWVLSRAFNYLLKYQLQYQPSDRFIVSVCLLLPHYKFCCCLACSSKNLICLINGLLFNDLFNLMGYLQNIEVSQKGKDIIYFKHSKAVFTSV